MEENEGLENEEMLFENENANETMTLPRNNMTTGSDSNTSYYPNSNNSYNSVIRFGGFKKRKSRKVSRRTRKSKSHKIRKGKSRTYRKV
jgi:hypothetical protein